MASLFGPQQRNFRNVLLQGHVAAALYNTLETSPILPLRTPLSRLGVRFMALDYSFELCVDFGSLVSSDDNA